jgi:hypothetical protein
MEGAVAAGEALANDAGGGGDEDRHFSRCPGSTTDERSYLMAFSRGRVHPASRST